MISAFQSPVVTVFVLILLSVQFYLLLWFNAWICDRLDSVINRVNSKLRKRRSKDREDPKDGS